MLRYLRTWFTLHVMCNISPRITEMLIYTTYLTYGILRLLQYLWNIGKVHAFLSKFEDDIRYNFVGFRCGKLVLVRF
ncbi:hypothetical protein MtrunA17_Chr4g0063021 [Medicago truncatula]|uniref:Uncharacterized protein n=1 Tax=Medicago truncatula TaxID=3880 RepID=A0A396IJ59_MEDTR|nr:hypothetical protein MtrunA17_Chr4g0063021 [Medicago truncatula]